MESQLLLKYLKDNTCGHGIYLVGWYQCPTWDPADYRKCACNFQTMEELKESLSNQAALLSNKEVIIKATILDVTIGHSFSTHFPEGRA